jgi:hypothetical protein
MTHAYTELTTHEGDFDDILDKMALIYIFKPVIEEYNDSYRYDKYDRPLLVRLVIKYIVHVYSVDSPKITLGADWGTSKNAIFKMLKIPSDLFSDIVLLRCKAVQRSVGEWLEFQDNRQFKKLAVLQDVYVQMQSASLSDLRKGDGIAIDYDQKFKCVEYMHELSDMIDRAESTLQQNTPHLRAAWSEKKKAEKQDNTFTIERRIKSPKTEQ